MAQLNIVLVEPEIPQNTGNIARTCAAAGVALHLVGPMGFTIDDKKLKRAGLDYWNLLDISYYTDLQDFYAQNTDINAYYCTTKGSKLYSEEEYTESVFLFFGKETAGLPERLLIDNYSRCIRIPMIDNARSLNLSNAVAIVTYEVLRRRKFEGLLIEGNLPKLI